MRVRLLSAAIALLLLGGGGFVLLRHSRHTNVPSARQAAPPTVAFAPDATLGAPVAGTVQVAVAVNGQAQKVEFYIDSQLRYVNYNQPFTYALDTTSLGNGQHTLRARVYNVQGQSSWSKPLTITVNNPAVSVTQPPATAANTPANSAAGSGGTAAAANTKGNQTASSSSGNSGNSGGSNTTGSGGDTTPPSVPNGLSLSASDAWTAVLSWNASSDNTGVASYRVYRDGQLVATVSQTSYTDTGTTAGNTYSYAVAAVDAAGNASAASAAVGISLPALTIWSAADIPGDVTDADSGAIEVGVKFRPSVNGEITGVRFFKSASNTGPHIGNLWASDGTNLASATFTNETGSGWQEVTFANPVAVTANTTYIVSYHTTVGHYSSDANYFASADFNSGYLDALQSGTDGNNGVYAYSASSTFPANGSGNASNYWVDALFAPAKGSVTPTRTVAGSPGQFAGYPDASNTGVPAGHVLALHPRELLIPAGWDNLTVSNLDVTGDIDDYSNNLVVENSRVTTTNFFGILQRSGASGMQVLHSTITGLPGQGADNGGEDYAIANNSAGSIEIGYNDMSEFGDVISTGHGNVHDNYVHDIQTYVPLGANPPGTYQHTDAFISDGNDSAGLTLEHNTFLNQTDIAHGASASIGLFPDNGPGLNMTVDDNVLAGGAYALYAGGVGSSNVHITNNKFSTIYWPNSGYYGANANTYWDASGSGNIWSGNVWIDGPNAGQTVSP